MEAQAQALGEPDAEDMDDHIGDDLLRLIFIACHPVLPAEARAALTLRLIGGLTTHEIARAFLVAEPAIAQRIVRAKRRGVHPRSRADQQRTRTGHIPGASRSLPQRTAVTMTAPNGAGTIRTEQHHT